MKIPKCIDKLIDRRMRLAERLFDACDEFEEWLEKHGADLDNELMEDTRGGVEIYANPYASANRVREYIEKEL